VADGHDQGAMHPQGFEPPEGIKGGGDAAFDGVFYRDDGEGGFPSGGGLHGLGNAGKGPQDNGFLTLLFQFEAVGQGGQLGVGAFGAEVGEGKRHRRHKEFGQDEATELLFIHVLFSWCKSLEIPLNPP